MSYPSRKDAETIMTMIGILTILGLSSMDDFLEIMMMMENNAPIEHDDSIDYLVYLLNTMK